MQSQPLIAWKLGAAMGLEEGSFGPEFMTTSVDEKIVWNPTWQVWMTLVGIVRICFLGTALRGMPDKNCGGNLGLQ